MTNFTYTPREVIEDYTAALLGSMRAFHEMKPMMKSCYDSTVERLGRELTARQRRIIKREVEAMVRAEYEQS